MIKAWINKIRLKMMWHGYAGQIMDYLQYISSAEWTTKRKARLEMDGNRCRLCDEDGSRFRLEVHHRPSSYAKIPNESIVDDLITVCSRCHDLITNSIRADRYGRLDLPQPIQFQNNVQKREDINHGMETGKLQIDIVRPADNAQRTDGESTQQVVEIAQTDFCQANKDRGRL
jgi:cytochrome c553